MTGKRKGLEQAVDVTLAVIPAVDELGVAQALDQVYRERLRRMATGAVSSARLSAAVNGGSDLDVMAEAIADVMGRMTTVVLEHITIELGLLQDLCRITGDDPVDVMRRRLAEDIATMGEH